MTDINALRKKYFIQDTDTNPPTEPLPHTFQDCRIGPLIDCAKYNEEIESALSKVGTGPDEETNKSHFIFIANWWFL